MDSPINTYPTKIILVDMTPEMVECAKKLMALRYPDKPKNQWVQLELFPELKESESDKQRD